MKVVHLTTVHPPFDTRIFHKEAKTLAQAGYEVVLIAQHERNEVVDGVKIIALPRPRNRFVRILGLTWQAFRLALRERADIYHFHDPELIPVGILLKFFTKPKVIYDVHEDYPLHMLSKQWLPPPLRRIASWLMRQLEKIGTRWFDATITPTNAITERFQRLKARKVLTLHNFPLFENKMNVTQKIVLSPRYDLIHVGTLSPSRLSFMFSVAQELKNMGYDCKWCILGASLEIIKWAEKELKHHYLNLYDNFVFVQWVPYAEVKQYLLQSRIGVNHHPLESRFLVAIPAKFFEYMACGLPIVSSDLPLLRELIGNEDCAILVKPGDVQEFAKAIKFLLDNPAVAKEMGIKGAELIKTKYNWQKESEKLLELYQELLEGAG